jgi:hypothetical protein
MYHLSKKIVTLIAITIITINCFSQDVNYRQQKIAPAALKSDFMLLRDTLQKVHPGLYRYKTKSQMNWVFDSCYASIKDSMTVPDFYALIKFAIAAFEDGHSNCHLPRQVADDYVRHVKVFPAMVMFINGHGYIYCNKQNNALAGAEILSINNRPMSKIIQRLFSFIPSDAGIQSRKNWEIPEYFNMLYNTVFGESDEYRVTYKTLHGETVNTTLHAGLMVNIMCPPPAVFIRPSRYLSLTYAPGNVAVLTIKTFFDGFLQQTGENFKTFLDSAFNDIANKKAAKLIIDIRRNQGGNDENGALLYAYLSQKPFKYYDALETTTEKFAESRHSNLKLQQPKSNSFEGKLYILADGRSFSASSEFSSIVKTNNRGLFIGEENGGGYYGNTSGDDVTVTLPASQISCRVPLLKYTLAVKKLKNGELGIMPDYPRYTTISDIINGTDSQMDYTLQVASIK